MDVIERIIELRDKKGYSTNKLANLAGLTQSTLQSILSNKNLPTIPTLEKICDALGISLSAFFRPFDNYAKAAEPPIIYEYDMLTPELIELIKSVRDLSPEQLIKLNEFIKIMK